MALDIQIDPGKLREIYDRTVELDLELAAISSSASSAKKVVTDSIVNEHRSIWEQTVTAMADHAAQYDTEQLIAFVYGIRQGLQNKFGERMSELITSRVKEIEASQPEKTEASDSQRTALVTESRELRAAFNNLSGLLKLLGHNVDNVPQPSSLRGVTGKRSRRSKLEVTYTHSIDGSPRRNASDNLSSIAQSIFPGKEFMGDRTDELWKYLESPGPDPEGNPQAGFDRKNPPEEFRVYFPNGKLLVMTAVDSREPVVADDDSDEEEAEDDDE